jgi:alkylhydroperoxidase family enzyme
MPHIKLTEIHEAQGELKALYDDIQRVRGEGKVSNLFKGYGAFPALARANFDRLQVLMTQGTLSRKLKESIMMAAAQINGCEY